MKRIIYAVFLTAILLLLNACSTASTYRYYTVSNGTTVALTGTICEYDMKDRCIVTQNFSFDAGMTTPSIRANSRTKMVKIYISDFDLWVGELYYLYTVNNNHFILYDSTPLVDYEPITF